MHAGSPLLLDDAPKTRLDNCLGKKQHLIKVALEDARLKVGGLADQIEEGNIVVAVQGGEALDGKPHPVVGPQVLAQRLHFPQRVPLVHVHQDVVGPELILSRTRDPLEAEVIVDVLQGLQTFCEVFIVQLWGEVMVTLFTEALGTDNVEPDRSKRLYRS